MLATLYQQGNGSQHGLTLPSSPRFIALIVIHSSHKVRTEERTTRCGRTKQGKLWESLQQKERITFGFNNNKNLEREAATLLLQAPLISSFG